MIIVCTPVCKNLKSHNNLTCNKHYDVLVIVRDVYTITNDIGILIDVVLGEHFISLEDYRELQIDKII